MYIWLLVSYCELIGCALDVALDLDLEDGHIILKL